MKQHSLQVSLSDLTDSVFPKLSLLQLPVPIFLPVTPDNADPTVKSMKESIQPDPIKGELNLKSEKKKMQDKRNESEDRQKERVVTKEGQRQEIRTPKGKTSDEHEVMILLRWHLREEGKSWKLFQLFSYSLWLFLKSSG